MRRGTTLLCGALSLGLLVVMGTAPGAEPSPCDMRYPSDSTVRHTCRALRRDESLERLFGEYWRNVARFNRIDRRHVRAGLRLRVPERPDSIECFTPLPSRLDSARNEARYVLVDLSEQFLGAYEHGKLVFSAPIASGGPETPTPAGDYRITMLDREHRSSIYKIEGTDRPYPMDWALLFLVSREGEGYWIHGRDLPGFPASHGCIGLSDEAMQQRCYGSPAEPVLADARALYQWVGGPAADSTRVMTLDPGVPMRVIGAAPVPFGRLPSKAAADSSGLSHEHDRGDTLAGEKRAPLRPW